MPGTDQGPPLAVALVGGTTYRLHQVAVNRWALGSDTQPQQQVQAPPSGPVAKGFRLQNVASSVGIDFRQGSFRYGMTSEAAAMMGGGVCWLDYNNDGWLDLFVVNSYADDNLPAWQDHGGLPTSALYENVHGHFVDVTKSSARRAADQG